jgi:hypothetical protein
MGHLQLDRSSSFVTKNDNKNTGQSRKGNQNRRIKPQWCKPIFGLGLIAAKPISQC